MCGGKGEVVYMSSRSDATVVMGGCGGQAARSLDHAQITPTSSRHAPSLPWAPPQSPPGPGLLQNQRVLPYQRADRFMEGQAEAVAAQGQYQLLTLLQKPERAAVSVCPGPTSVRIKHSDPDGFGPQV